MGIDKDMERIVNPKSQSLNSKQFQMFKLLKFGFGDCLGFGD
jgi:hypothetical protein